MRDQDDKAGSITQLVKKGRVKKVESREKDANIQQQLAAT